jgi:hypothetical protein
MKWSDIKACAREAHVNHAFESAARAGDLSVDVHGKKKEATSVSICLSIGQGCSGGVTRVVIVREAKHQYHVAASNGRIPGFNGDSLTAFGKACIRAVRKHHVKG